MEESADLFIKELFRLGFKSGTDDGIKYWFQKDNIIINYSGWDWKFIRESDGKEINSLQDLNINKQELMQLLQDMSEQVGSTYEERGIHDSKFDELADIILSKIIQP